MSDRLHTIVDENLAFLWKYVRGLGSSASVADDVVQECFLVLTAKLDKVQVGKERSFLIGCATRINKAQWRSHQRYTPLSQEVPSHESPDNEHAGNQARDLLARFVASLSEKHKPVFVLYEIQEFSVPEISDSLKIPVGTVNSRLRKARESYRRYVSQLANHEQRLNSLHEKEASLETTF